MLEDRQLMPIPAALFEGLTHHHLTGDATGALTNALITSYERAIQDGLSPRDALSTILNWVAEEMSRLHEKTSRSVSG